jgi:DNA-binding transcriptional MerR regulator
MQQEKKELRINLKQSPNPVFRSGDDFCMAFARYKQDCENISKILNEKRHRLKNKDVTHRVLNHWEELGLLTCQRETGKRWRKYSIMDLIWVRIMSELRKFGFPLAGMKKVKESLGFLKDTSEDSDFPFLEFYITQAISTKIPVFLVVFQNGDSEPITQREYDLTNELWDLNHHIVIRLNRLLQEMFPKKDLTAYNAAIAVPSEELDLLFMIRMQDHESISLKTNDGKSKK